MSKKAKSRNRKPASAVKLVVIIIFLLAIALIGAIFYLESLGNPYKPNDDTIIQVEIPEGATIDNIADILEKNGVIGSSAEFKVYARVKKFSNKFQAGSYALSADMSADDIAETLEKGKTDMISVTIPEGYTEYDVADKLSSLGIVNKDVFIKELESSKWRKQYSFLKDAQKGDHILEGYLFPSTYMVSKTESADQIIKQMLDKYKTVFTDKYEARAKELGYSENEIIIIASIIEKECGADKDRKNVASVIYNRLDIGKNLQMDSTIQYALSLESERKDELSNKDTTLKSEYNTYKHSGLPAGPICSPGESSIKAALYPAKTNYLYFVLSDKLDNTMVFESSYKAFLKDKNAYYKAKKKAQGNSN
jgi:UPF0755 protein